MDQITSEDIIKSMETPKFLKNWMLHHTPYKRINKVGRNDICPFCNSGKKFKNCECYKEHRSEYEDIIKYAD